MRAPGSWENIELHSRAAWANHGAGGVSPDVLREALTYGTLVSAARATAQRIPDREAIRIGGEAVDHGTLDFSTRCLAAHLRATGTRIGSRIVIAGANSISFVLAYLGAVRAGASVTLASPMLHPAELRKLLDETQPVVAIVSSDRDEQLRGHSTPRLTLETGANSIHAAIAASLPVADLPLRSSAIVHLAFTSGTTGKPKATPLTHANLLASVRGVIAAWHWTDADVLVHALPMQHAHGLTALHLTLLTGSRSVILPTFEPETLCRTIDDHKATVHFGVPTIYDQLVRSGAIFDADLSSLRLVISGSAPLSPRTSDAVATALGTRPLERYGLTEAGFVLSNHLQGPATVGAVGSPLPGMEVDLVGPDLQSVTDGVAGEIIVRGPQVFAGYLDHGEADDSWLDGGWFRTGDLGQRSPTSGSITITGRLKELIITGGLNVYPREVELVIEAQPGVRAAAVVGVPSERWGEEVTAYIEADSSFKTDALAEALSTELASYKCPKRYLVVDQLPRNHMGKIVRSEL